MEHIDDVANDLPAWRHERNRLFRENGALLGLHVDLTTRCPLNCVHCYWNNIGHFGGNEMPLSAWLEVLDQAVDLNCLFLVVSGGEPMVWPDFWPFMERARELRFFIRLKTTAVLLDKNDAKRLGGMAPIEVDVSLHGSSALVHDSIVRSDGAFDRTIGAVNLLVSEGVRVRIMMSVLKYNEDDVERVRALAQRLGTRFSESRTMFAPVGTVDIDNWRKQVCAMDARVPEAKRLNRGPVDPDDFICGAAREGLYVAPDLNIHPCVGWHEVLDSVGNGGLAGALRSQRAREIGALRHRDRTFCMSTCGLETTQCAFCPGQSMAEHGNPTGPNATACASLGRRIPDGWHK